MNAPKAHETGTVPALAQPVSRTFADFVAGYSYDQIPPAVRERAKLLMLDAVGIALASGRYEFAHHTLTGIMGMAGRGECSVLGMPHKLPVRDAVLMNGLLVHGLDYDDTHVEAIVHPTCSAFPLALSLTEHLDVSGRDLLAAYVLGVEISTRIGMSSKPAFHDFGFHPTGIAGHFACALQAGWLLRLNARTLMHAQGIAGSTAAASQEFLEEGAWNKRMHPGWAGIAGITAANLARGGFVGPSRPYEGRFGLFNSHLHERAAEIDYAKLTGGLGQVWETANVAVKPYPVCHLIHACADSVLELRRKHNLSPTNIKSIRALLPQPTLHIVAEPHEQKIAPTNDYEAKFSAQYMVATCVVRGHFGLAELMPDALKDPAALALAAKVTCETDPDSTFPTYFSGGVVVTTTDGRELRHHEPINRGAGSRALSGEDITAKFMENATLAVSESRAKEIRTAVLEMDSMDAREVARRLSA